MPRHATLQEIVLGSLLRSDRPKLSVVKIASTKRSTLLEGGGHCGGYPAAGAVTLVEGWNEWEASDGRRWLGAGHITKPWMLRGRGHDWSRVCTLAAFVLTQSPPHYLLGLAAAAPLGCACGASGCCPTLGRHTSQARPFLPMCPGGRRRPRRNGSGERVTGERRGVGERCGEEQRPPSAAVTATAVTTASGGHRLGSQAAPRRAALGVGVATNQLSGSAP